MRLHLALALAAVLLPALAAAQTDEWVRDDMGDESLWLVRTGNLAREAPRAGTLPGAPDGGSHWVMSKGDGPAYVVYFIPGRIHEVEVDTHRLAGVSGDFSLAVSTDGKLYQPLDAGAVLLDSSFGWDYRLMASDQIPENATHLLVQFPEGSTAHGLSEVWIRYTWDDALVKGFLPTPAPVNEPAPNTLAAQSDAELQVLLDRLMAQPATPPAREDPPPAGPAPVSSLPAFAAEPLRAPHSIDGVSLLQSEPAGAADDTNALVELEEESAGSGEPDAVGLEAALIDTEIDTEEVATTAPEGPVQVEALRTSPVDAEPQALAPAESSELLIAPDPESEATPPEAPEESAEVASPDTTPIDVAVFEAAVEPAPLLDVAQFVPEAAGAILQAASEAEANPVSDTALANAPGDSSLGGIPAPTVAEPAGEVFEETVVLPTFVLPVFAESASSQPAAAPEFEPAPQSIGDPVVIEIPSAASEDTTLAALQTAPADDRSFERPAPSPADSSSDDPAKHPAPASVPAAVRIEPTIAEKHLEAGVEDDPGSRPTLKMKRTGPRSKSRGTYVARG